MGMFDNLIILDEPLACPAGHRLTGLQTKGFDDPSMSTYLIRGGRVVRAVGGSWRDENEEEETSAWRITGDQAVHETHYRLEPTTPPTDLCVYCHCGRCEPVLVRTDRATLWGDIVQEHHLFVEFSLHFPEGEPMRAQRITGGREELMEELRRGGLRVLSDDDPLAIAHREIQRARREAKGGSRRF